MRKKKKKKALPPRVKRMTRSGRLQSARSWLPTYAGKNIVAGYRKHFGVDWACAFKELETLGVKLDPEYKTRLLKSVEGHIEARRRRKARLKETYDYDLLDQDDNFAYIAGYTAWGFAYGVTWEQWEQLEQRKLIDPEGSIDLSSDEWEEWEQFEWIDAVTGENISANDEPEDIPF